MSRSILWGSRAVRIACVCILAIVCSLPLVAQNTGTENVVFGQVREEEPDTSTQPRPNSWGVDLLISNGGFGLGTFYRHEYSDELSGFLDFSISEAKDDDEREYIDYWGQRFTPGKVNRFLLMPLFVGAQKRLFKDDIMDNFRPYVNAAFGPSMIYVFPNDQEFFSAIGHGRPRYTLGGYIGVGSYFGSEKSNVLGLNLRYYFVPYKGGLESMQNLASNEIMRKTQFGGFFITLNFGSAW